MQFATLKQNEAFIKVPNKYSDFADVFLEKKILVLPEQTKLNKHVIKLEDGKQPLYWLIYSLNPVKLEIFKTYIKTHQKTEFISPSKSFADTSILFDKKPNGSFYLYINY